jgi:hypothetical protein
VYKVFTTDDSGCQTLCRHNVGKEGGRICLATALPNAETCGTRHQGNFVPLDPNFLYVISQKTPKLQIFQEPSIPFSHLDLTYKATLMDMALPLDEWRSLFVLIKALGDNDGKPITAEDMELKRTAVAAPLKTPGRFKKKRQQEGGDGTSRTLFEDVPAPPRVDTVKLEVIDEIGWIRDGAPVGFVSHVKDLKDTVVQTAESLPGLYRDFSAMQALMANDIDNLETRVGMVSESTKAAKQDAATSPSVFSSDPDALRALIAPMTAELKRVSVLADEAALSSEQASKAVVEMKSQVVRLENQLNLTLQAMVDLKQAPPVSKPRVEFERTAMGTLEGDRLSSLEEQVKLLSAKHKVSGTITVFTDLISGIRTVEDVEAWLLRYFYDVGEDPPEDKDDPGGVGWGLSTATQRRKADTTYMSFGPFSDLFVVLAIAEDLECQSTKGETLKEMEAFDKAGLNHPGEATVAYALRQSAPPLFSKSTGVAAVNKTYLKALKCAEDWDRMAGGHVFPGLKQKIESHMESIQAEVASVICETLDGRLRVTSLAKDMLACSIRFLTMLCEYMSNTFKELTDISKFPKPEAWLLVTQIVARIFRDMNAAKKGIRSVHPKTSGLTNTAKTLFAMLRIHEVMREYEELEIKNHPAVSSEYVKFLATHVGFNEARSIRDSVTEVDKKVQKIDTEIKRVAEVAKSAERLAKFAKEKVG